METGIAASHCSRYHSSAGTGASLIVRGGRLGGGKEEAQDELESKKGEEKSQPRPQSDVIRKRMQKKRWSGLATLRSLGETPCHAQDPLGEGKGQIIGSSSSGDRCR